MRSIAILVVLAVLGLAGCGRTERVNSEMDAWKGKTEVQLVQHYGAPTASYEADGAKFLTWDDRRVGMTFWTYGTKYCKRTFQLAGGVVVASTWEGQNCSRARGGVRTA
jgi:hypothetical protein